MSLNVQRGCLFSTSALLIAFGASAATRGPALVLAMFLGASIFGCMVGLYALAPSLYSTSTRATGMGWAIGMGRIGGIAAPTLAGLLVDAGSKSGELYALFALPLLLAVLVVRVALIGPGTLNDVLAAVVSRAVSPPVSPRSIVNPPPDFPLCEIAAERRTMSEKSAACSVQETAPPKAAGAAAFRETSLVSPMLVSESAFVPRTDLRLAPVQYVVTCCWRRSPPNPVRCKANTRRRP